MDAARQEAESLANVGGERFDRVVRLAQAIFGAPIAALNLVGESRQYTVSAVGAPRRSIPLADSICRHTVQQSAVFEVPDLRADPRFESNPIVAGPPRVRFYAGVPLHSASGQQVGTLCILDLVPRELGEVQQEMLRDLGAVLERELAVESDLRRLGEVQRLLLPSRAPDIDGVDVAGRVRQAREAGGDFFDWQVVQGRMADSSQDRLQVVLADVMGKGLSAALLASEMRAVMRAHSWYVDLGHAVQRTQEATARDLDAIGSFVTLWAGRLNPRNGRLTYVDAGHGLAVVASSRGVRRLTQRHLPLGVPGPDSWSSAEDSLGFDEVLILVSDGVFDVVGSEEDAVAALHRVADAQLPAAEIVDRIIAFSSQRGATDDLTAVAVRRTGGRA